MGCIEEMLASDTSGDSWCGSSFAVLADDPSFTQPIVLRDVRLAFKRCLYLTRPRERHLIAQMRSHPLRREPLPEG